jgi:hypothetical protein
MRRRLSACLALAAITLVSTAPAPRAEGAAFDFDSGNALFEVVGPPIVSALLQTSTANDAPFILRNVVIIDNAWFDAIAPYHPTAVGIYSRLGRRPASESATNRHKNIALIYASYRIMNSRCRASRPTGAPWWNQLDSIRMTRAKTSPPRSGSATLRVGAWPRRAKSTA